MDNMDKDQHISEISSKDIRTLQKVSLTGTGILHLRVPRKLHTRSYKTLVRLKLEFAPSIWSPYSKTQIKQIMKVQDASPLYLQDIAKHIDHEYSL